MKSVLLGALAVTLLLASAASAGERAIGIQELSIVHEGFGFQANIPGEPHHYFVHSPGRPWLGIDVLPDPLAPAPAAFGITHTWDSGLAIVVHGLGGNDTLLGASFFHAGNGVVPSPRSVLRDRGTQALVPPVATRGVAIDPSDPSGNVVYAFDSIEQPDGFVRALATRFFKPVGGLGYVTEVVDYSEGGVNYRVTPIGFAPSTGPLAADFATRPDGGVFAAFASPAGVELYDMIDPQGQIVAGSPLAMLPAPAGFDPESVQLGIIAILIGLVQTPVPSVSFQAGDTLFLYAYDGAGGFDPITQQTIPAGAQGIIEEKGTLYYFRDGTSNTIFRGVVGSPADTSIGLADVVEVLDAMTPPASPSSFESADADARLEIGSDWLPPAGVARSAIAAAGDAVLRSVADLDLAFGADGRRGAVLRGVLPNQSVSGNYESSGALARSFVMDVEQLPSGDPFDPVVDEAVIGLTNADVTTLAPFVFGDADGLEAIALLGITSKSEIHDWWISASSYQAEVVPWLWLLPGASASIENASAAAYPRSLGAELFESGEEQTAIAVTPTSFVAATTDTAHADVQAFAADAAAALGGPVEVLVFASAAARTETIDYEERITIGHDFKEATTGEDLYLFWGGGLTGAGMVGVTIDVENDEPIYIGHDREHHGSIAALGASLAGTTEPLLADKPWNRVSVTFEGDPDQPILLGVPGVGIVRRVPEPEATAAYGAACVALLLSRHLRSAVRRRA